MRLLRFVAGCTGLASAILYLSAMLAGKGSWLAATHPLAFYLPVAVTLLLGGAVSCISTWRLTTRTLPQGGPDLFVQKWSDLRFESDWDLAFYAGILLIPASWIFRSEMLVLAGFCLFIAGGSQGVRRVYEDATDA